MGLATDWQDWMANGEWYQHHRSLAYIHAPSGFNLPYEVMVEHGITSLAQMNEYRLSCMNETQGAGFGWECHECGEWSETSDLDPYCEHCDEPNTALMRDDTPAFGWDQAIGGSYRSQVFNVTPKQYRVMHQQYLGGHLGSQQGQQQFQVRQYQPAGGWYLNDDGTFRPVRINQPLERTVKPYKEPESPFKNYREWAMNTQGFAR